MYVENVDAVIGLQYGDEGKGKIAASIAKQIDYTLTARYNGGSNAGHTISFEYGPALKLHQIPSGVAFAKNSYIGPGCLVNFAKLKEEATNFEEIMGFSPFDYLSISKKAIVVTEADIQSDIANQATTQGSTSSGVAPAYSNFYNRSSLLAKELHFAPKNENIIRDVHYTRDLLLEGAQGWYLNPYQGDYPYTTSSSCHPASAAVTFGFPANKIRNIIGVAKCYETRSGIDPNFLKVRNIDATYEEPMEDFTEIYNAIVDAGNEYGVTTGRRRNIRFLDVTRLIDAVNNSGTNILVLQKWDILEEVSYKFNNVFNYYFDSKLYSFKSSGEMIGAVYNKLFYHCPNLEKLLISASPICDIDWKEHL